MTRAPAPALPYVIQRVLHAAMLFGVLVFAAIAWYMRRGDGPLAQAIPALPYAWAVIAIGASVAALMLWRAVPALVSAGDTAKLQQRLVTCWALAEGVGVLGAVTFLLTGAETILWSSLALAALGFAIFRPRSEWTSQQRGR